MPKRKNMTTEEHPDALSTQLDSAAGSIGDWRALPTEQSYALMHDGWLTLAIQIGSTEFQKLSPDLQFDVDFSQ